MEAIALLMLDISSGRNYLSGVPRSQGRLAQLLKATRESVALSLREVEKRTGISNAYLSQLENGRTTNPSPHVLAKLSRAYAISYTDLMLAAGYSEDTRLGNAQ